MLFIAIFSILLLWINHDLPAEHKVATPIIYGHQQKVVKSFKTRRLARLANSVCTGNKIGLSSTYRKKFKKLGIYHLFTPSGIHLTSLLLFLSPLIHILRRKGRWWSLALDLGLIIITQLMPGFHSLKRVVLLATAIRQLRYKNEPLPLFTNFIIAFGVSALIGSYNQSPLSFTYSFLFLGMICSLQNQSKYKLPFALFGAQLIVSYYQGDPIYWGNIIVSPFLTAIFSLAFPLIFISYFIPFSWGLLEWALKWFIQLVDWGDTVASTFGEVVGTPILIGAVLLFIIATSWKQRGLITVIALSFFCGELYNLPMGSFKRVSGAKATNYGKIDKIRRTKRGYVVNYSSGKTCYPKLYPAGIYERCKY